MGALGPRPTCSAFIQLLQPVSYVQIQISQAPSPNLTGSSNSLCSLVLSIHIIRCVQGFELLATSLPAHSIGII